MKALIVVDVQNDFCPGGSFAVSGGDEIVPIINGLIPRFSFIAATLDWHPVGHISFASTHSGKEPFSVIQLGDAEQVLWPDHCIAGTKGADFHPGLDTSHFNIILRKGTKSNLDSYSAFFENDRLTPTGLAGCLKETGVDTVYLCGLATDVCVYYSAVDARRLGFTTFLIEDASRGVDVPEGNLDFTLKDMRSQGVQIITAKQVT